MVVCIMAPFSVGVRGGYPHFIAMLPSSSGQNLNRVKLAAEIGYPQQDWLRRTELVAADGLVGTVCAVGLSLPRTGRNAWRTASVPLHVNIISLVLHCDQ